MPDYTVEWFGKKVFAAYRKQVTSGMRGAMRMVRDDVRGELAGAPESAPGQPPGKEDGDLIRAVKYKVRSNNRGVVGVVGTLDDHEQAAKGARLAGGFAGRDRRGRQYNQKPRPWLRPVIRRRADDIVRKISNGG